MAGSSDDEFVMIEPTSPTTPTTLMGSDEEEVIHTPPPAIDYGSTTILSILHEVEEEEDEGGTDEEEMAPSLEVDALRDAVGQCLRGMWEQVGDWALYLHEACCRKRYTKVNM